MTVPRLGHINIVVRDLEATRDFFVGNFGFQAGKMIQLQAPWVDALNNMTDIEAQYIPLTKNGATTHIELLRFVRPEAPPRASVALPNEYGYRHIDFEVEDIEAMSRQIEAQGWQLLSPVQSVDAMRLKTVYFLGPEGVLIQMTEFLGPR